MTSKSDFDNAEKVIKYYAKVFSIKFKYEPIMNRNKCKFMVIEMLKDINITTSKKLIDYFISHNREAPEFSELLYNYGDLVNDMNLENADKAHRQQLLSDTEKSVRDFRERYGKN